MPDRWISGNFERRPLSLVLVPLVMVAGASVVQAKAAISAGLTGALLLAALARRHNAKIVHLTSWKEEETDD